LPASQLRRWQLGDNWRIFPDALRYGRDDRLSDLSGAATWEDRAAGARMGSTPRPRDRPVTDTADAATVDLSVFSEPDRIRDPYPLYRDLRSRDDLPFDSFYGVYVVTSYAEVSRLLRDPRCSSRRGAVDDGGLWDLSRLPAASRDVATEIHTVFRRNLLVQDPPCHTAMRRRVGEGFTRRAVTVLEPTVAHLCEELLGITADSGGEIEVVGDFASRLPIMVIAVMLGLSRDQLPQLIEWSDALSAFKDPNPAQPERHVSAAQRLADFTAYLRTLVAERAAASPRQDVFQALLDVTDLEDDGSREELVANLAGIIVGGHETAANLLSAAFYSFAREPEQYSRLRHDPQLVDTAVEEVLRFESPVQWLIRTVTEPVEIGDRVVEAGATLGLFLGSANRDPAEFPDPDRLDVGRTPNHHLAFGMGRHLCLGAPLARLEGRMAVRWLVEHCRRIDADTEEVRWNDSFAFRGLDLLPVRLGLC